MRNNALLKSNLPVLLLFILLQIFVNPLLANINSSDSLSIFDELNFQEEVEVNLSLNMDSVFGSRREHGEHPATFSFRDKDGVEQSWDIKVRQRGKFRRTKCENLPPLKLNFRKRDLAKAGLLKFDDLKLVTHCVNDEELAKQLLVREYLAYKMYNQLTAQSYRAQFIKINYQDEVTGKVKIQYGILLEDTAQLKWRVKVKEKENGFALSKDKYNSSQVKVVSLYNYLIGNSDWSIGGKRNVKVLEKDERCILIPYDFDFSGFVDAPYTKLKPEHGIASAKERVFLGFKEDSKELASTIKYFKKMKPAILGVLEDCQLLSSRERKELKRYLNSFYQNTDYINLPVVSEQTVH